MSHAHAGIAPIRPPLPQPAPYPLPADEAGRLAALDRYGVLAGLPAEPLEGLARTAALALRAPVALVSFVGADQQVFKARVGTDLKGTPREASFCAHTICGVEPFIVPDAALDGRFANNPLVTGALSVRAYAGAPLRSPDGHGIGSICVIDTEPRTFSAAEVEGLQALAASVMDALELRSDMQAHKRVAAEYRALFRAHPQPMCVFDAETLRILTANPSALAAYGYSAEEMAGMTIRELRPEGEVRHLEQRMATLQDGRASSGPWLHRRKDGSTFHVHVESTPTTFRGRRARLVRITDATETVRAQEGWSESEALNESAMNALDDLFFMADAEGKILRWNRKAAEATGYTDEELAAKTILEFIAPDDHGRVAEAFAEAFADGRARVSGALVAKDGSQIPYEFSGSVLRDAQREPIGVCGIGRDVTPWTQAEEASAGKVAVLKAVAQGLPLGDVLAEVVRLLEAQLPGALCSVLLHDAEAGVLRHGAAPGLPDAYNAAVDGIPVGPNGGSCGTAAFLNRPVLADDIAADPRWEGYRAFALSFGLRACWSTPITAPSGEVLGTFAVYHREARASTPKAVRLIELAVNLAAIAIEHDRRATQLAHRDRLLQGAAGAMFALLTEPDLQDAATAAMGALGEATGVDRVYLFEYHAEPETGALLASQRMEWVGEGASPEIDNPELQGFRFGEALPEWSAALMQGEVAGGLVSDLGGGARELMEAQGILSLLLVPVLVDGEAWGFMGFDDCCRMRAWTAAEQATLRAAAAAFGSAYTRARSEQALREANARYEAIADNAPGIVFQCAAEPDGTLTFPYVSGGGGTALGVDLTVLQEEPERIAEVIHPGDWAGFQASVTEAVTSVTPWSWEGRIVTEAGDVRWAAGVSKPLRSEDGRLLWHGLFLDATARKEAETARCESEERYRSLFNTMEEGFCVIELIYDGGEVPVDYRFLEANPAFGRHTGLNDAMGRRVTELTSRINPMWLEVYGRAARSGEAVRAEGESRAMGRWFSVEAHRVGGTEDRPRLAVLFSDISERKAHEQGLIAAHEAAEEGRRAAEEASRLKSTLLTNMSHELRTPLTGIIGFADLLAGEVEGEQREMVQHIAESGKRLLATFTSVLDLAELDSGTFRFNVVEVPIGAALREVVARLSLHARKKGLSLTLDLPPGDVTVRADAAALRRIALNLITNAVKFTEAGGVSVEVRSDGGVGEIRVADTGVGISESFRPFLFREFQQESEGMSREFEGTGLGLAVSQRLARAMGGSIEVESGRGRGSTFTVRLPLA